MMNVRKPIKGWINKWGRRIAWYQLQLTANPPAQIAQTYRTTLTYMQLVEQPQPLSKNYVSTVTKHAKKLLKGDVSVVKPVKNEWQLVTSRRRKHKNVEKSNMLVEEASTKVVPRVPTYEEKIEHLIQKLACKRERRWASFQKQCERCNYHRTAPKSLSDPKNKNNAIFDRQIVIVILEKRQRVKERKAARRAAKNQ